MYMHGKEARLDQTDWSESPGVAPPEPGFLWNAESHEKERGYRTSKFGTTDE